MESLTRPFFHHRRKLSNVNSSNGLSFSAAKDAYDDVLLGAPKSKLGRSGAGGGASGFVARGGVVVEDYSEIFGGGNVKRGSSIPVLDLSDLEKGSGSYDSRRSNGKLDYSKIFGSFAAEDDVAAAVPPYEELFGGVKKAKRDAAKARTPADIGSPLKGSDRFNSSENNRGFSSESSDQFLDGEKQLNVSYHKTGQRSKDGLNGTMHIAQFHAVPGFTHFVDEDARLPKSEHKPFPQVKSDVNHSRSSSGDLSEGRSSRRGKWQLPERQASEGPVNGKDAVPSFTYFIDEDARQPKIQHKLVPQVRNDANHSRNSSGDTSEGKSSRRGKWQVPDRHASEGLFNSKEDCSQDKVDVKQHPNEVPMPSSSMANLNDIQGHPKRAKSLSLGAKAEALEKDSSGYFSPSSDEELDLNSAAAVSAAALKKAIQQAQESIRIAKELMERKKGSAQFFKSSASANASLKSKDREEIKHHQGMNDVRTNNMKEATINSEVRAFGQYEQQNARGSDGVPSSFTCRENLCVDSKIGEKREGSAEAAEEQGMGAWFSQLLNNGKNKMAALASQLVDNKNNIFQPANKHTCDAEEKIPVKDTEEKGTADSVDINPRLDSPGKIPYLEKNLDKSAPDLAPDQSLQGDTRSVTLMSAKDDNATEVEHSFIRQEKYEKKLLDCEETSYDRHLEPEILENGYPADEVKNIEQIKSGEEESFELEVEKKSDAVTWQENESRLAKEENWNPHEYSSLLHSNELKPKEETTIENSQNEQKNSQDEDSRNKSEGVQQQNIDVQRSMSSPEREENQNLVAEENLCDDIGKGPTRMYQHEDSASIDIRSDNSTESEKIEVNLEVQETNSTEGETVESENPGARLSPEAAIKDYLNAYNNDESTTSEGILEANEVTNSNKQTKLLEVTDLKKDDNQTGVTASESKEQNGHIESEEFFEEVEQATEEASVLKEDEMSETSCSDEGVSAEHDLESNIQDVSEALVSHANTNNFGFNTIICDQKPSPDMSTIGLTIEAHAGRGDATEASATGKNASYCGFADMDRQKEIRESDEESEVSIKPEKGDGLVHESVGDAENIWEDGIACDKEVEKDRISQSHSETEESEELLETDIQMNAGQSMENSGENICKTSMKEEKENGDRMQKEVKEKDFAKKIEVDQSEREREKNRIAVERAIREVRERAFAEARERAERAAAERATAEVRHRAMAGAREKFEKVSAVPKISTDKATTEAKLRAERAAVERATAEARERALEKALSQKSIGETRTQVEKFGAGKSSAASRDTGLKHSFSSSDLEGTQNESDQRRKARLERHQRIMERAAKALAEKNMRDILAQREQAERNRMAETLDADIKRWASGKEGNLRALLSTLQYILGPDSGWQPISLTEIITTTAVKKAYRKATLYVHPDKLQQRGASIQQKYICEKVFDLLKAAWNKFNSEER